MAESSDFVRALLARAPVVPVVTIADADTAAPLARALVAGGLPAVEVTLRTPAALAAIARIAAEVPEAVVGAGTVVRPEQVRDAVEAGARFAVSPGAYPALLDAAEEIGLPFLPGAATASESMSLLARGITVQKFFPAAAIGGVAALKGLAAPLPEVAFCPTGGIDAASAPAYLACPNVLAVGGSWVAPPAAMAAGDWAAIEALARAAAGLG